MALIAERTTDSQVPVNYLRIQRIDVQCAADNPHPKVGVLLGAYYNSDARKHRPQSPVSSEPVYVMIEDMIAAGFPDIRAIMYEYLRLHHPTFAGTNAASDAQPDAAPRAPVEPAMPALTGETLPAAAE